MCSCERRRENEEAELVPHFTNYEVGSLIVVLHPSQETRDGDATECKGNFPKVAARGDGVVDVL